ncbi:hypothetical protein SCLCIDRAFT_131650 [Scleroderma citrinum Foug A]|uniref:Amino acid permease/ SLC12A domain-containing protein n=1 Tax=Scleroderma citrinum Foug A TaxID=1036808 RepID=A0A0C2Z4N9_9AGAM|nr:hypothetical protein SCLCIDRAFT_131650 [Scleroderma citrinum Foug A]
MSTATKEIEKSSSDASHEKFPVNANLQRNPEQHFDVASIDLVQRRLKQRHIQMIAIAGTLGTGLFLGSGRALSGAGPVGALLAYTFMGSIAYSTLCSLGEMTCYAPISGSFPHFAARWVDPALGFAVRFRTACRTGVPVEITGAQLLITYWDNNANGLEKVRAVISLGRIQSRPFAAEFIFALIKLSLITGLILVGLVIDLGGAPNRERLGFQYWKNPGVLNGAGLEPKHIGLDRFLGILSVLVQAGFSFGGMEFVAVSASETENPRRNIPKAIRRVFYRICIFYILGIFVTGLIVPFNDPDLLQSTGTAAQSPYVIAMTRASIKVLPSIINAGVMTSAFSSSNSILFCTSRILYGLALRGQAPRFFAHCTSSGLPITAIAFTSAFAFLSLMNLSSGAATVFNWLVNLTTLSGLLTWSAINLTYLFFYRGFKAQGMDRKERLHYRSPLQASILYSDVNREFVIPSLNHQPGLAIWGLTWCTTIVLINGFEVFWNFTASGFLTGYINIPIFFGLYAFWKVVKKTKIWRPEEMDFVTGIPTLEQTEEPEIPPTTFWEKVTAVLF